MSTSSTPSIAASISLTLIDQGNTFLINGNYSHAKESYSNAIDALESNSNSNSKSESSTDIHSHSHSLNDSDRKLQKGLHFRALSHRAQVHLQLQNGSQAIADAEAALKLIERKSDTDDADADADADVLLDGEIAAAKIRKEKGMKLLKMQKTTLQGTDTKPKAETAAPVVLSSSSITSSKKKTKPPTCPKYQYYQSDSIMTISILESNLKPEHLKVEFSLDKLSVVIEKQGVQFTVICGTLFDAVDVQKCKIVHKDEKVLIKLKKVEKHEWHNLFGSGASKTQKESLSSSSPLPLPSSGGGQDSIKSSATVATAPTIDPKKKVNRPYASDKDWDAIDRNLREQEESEKPEGEEAVNKLFKSIYKDADENTRRAMIKSFQTSGGTCLSTNWGDVSQTDYEKKKMAPKGVEWKSWEGDRLPQQED